MIVLGVLVVIRGVRRCCFDSIFLSVFFSVFLSRFRFGSVAMATRSVAYFFFRKASCWKSVAVFAPCFGLAVLSEETAVFSFRFGVCLIFF